MAKSEAKTTGDIRGDRYRRLSDGKILTEDEMWAVFQPILDALTPEDTAAMDEYLESTAGRRLLVCEFSTPVVPVAATAYKEYLMRGLPRFGRAVPSNPEAYVYLAESIRGWPAQAAAQLKQASWSQVSWRNRTGSIVPLPSTRKPG